MFSFAEPAWKGFTVGIDENWHWRLMNLARENFDIDNWAALMTPQEIDMYGSNLTEDAKVTILENHAYDTDGNGDYVLPFQPALEAEIAEYERLPDFEGFLRGDYQVSQH